MSRGFMLDCLVRVMGAALVLLAGGVGEARAGRETLEDHKLTASDAAHPDRFGHVSVSGDWALVGAPLDGCAWAGDPCNPLGGEYACHCGSVYVYHYDGNAWVQQQTLIRASDAAPNDYFGVWVSVSGNTAVVGAYAKDCGTEPEDNYDCGAAYVFRLSGATWVEQTPVLIAPVRESLDWFGWSVAVSGDTVVVGAVHEDCAAGGNCGAAYVYRRNGATWAREQKLTASNPVAGDEFGHRLSVSGDVIVVGAHGDDGCTAGSNCGAAYVYRHDGASWVMEQKLVAVNLDAEDVVVGDAAAGDAFGGSVSVSGDTIVVGAAGDDCWWEPVRPNCGSAYVFEFEPTPRPTGCVGKWCLEDKLRGEYAKPGDEFGSEVAVSGETIVVGEQSYVGPPLSEGLHFTCAPGAICGAAYIYRKGWAGWCHEQKLGASDAAHRDEFGHTVSVSGDWVVVGAPFDDCGGRGWQSECGAMYVYSLGCKPACGSQKNNLECPEDVPGPAYANRRPVARLVQDCSAWCTAWLIGSPDCLITNRHCVTEDGNPHGDLMSEVDVATLSAEFNYECDACTGGVSSPRTVFDVERIIHSDADLDYALLELDGDPAATFGILPVNCDPVVVGDPCYLIHHASGGHKAYDAGVFATYVDDPASKCNTANHPFQVSYAMRAKGGSSGSPVFEAATNAVQVLEHCGPDDKPCAEGGIGIPMSALFQDAVSHIKNHGCTVNVNDSCYVCGDGWCDPTENQNNCCTDCGCPDDGNPCTNDECIENVPTYTNKPNGTPCPDDLFCNGDDTCIGGSCDNHTGDPCSGPDGDADCRESCDEADDDCFRDDPDDSFCNDNVYCNGADRCIGGACNRHLGYPCPGPDGDDDCSESCDEVADDCTLNDPNGAACNDRVFCNGPDTCTNGNCFKHPGDPCSFDEWCNEDRDVCIPFGNGDFEPDGDVDLKDFWAFQTCFGKRGKDECEPANIVEGEWIDRDDFALFVGAMVDP